MPPSQLRRKASDPAHSLGPERRRPPAPPDAARVDAPAPAVELALELQAAAGNAAAARLMAIARQSAAVVPPLAPGPVGQPDDPSAVEPTPGAPGPPLPPPKPRDRAPGPPPKHLVRPTGSQPGERGLMRRAIDADSAVMAAIIARAPAAVKEEPLLKAPSTTDERLTVGEGPDQRHRPRDAAGEDQARTAPVTMPEAPTAEPAPSLTATDPTFGAPIEHAFEARALVSTPNAAGSDATGERSAPGEAGAILQLPAAAAAEDAVPAADAAGMAAETVVGDPAESDAAIPSRAAASGAGAPPEVAVSASMAPEVPASLRVPITGDAAAAAVPDFEAVAPVVPAGTAGEEVTRVAADLAPHAETPAAAAGPTLGTPPAPVAQPLPRAPDIASLPRAPTSHQQAALNRLAAAHAAAHSSLAATVSADVEKIEDATGAQVRALDAALEQHVADLQRDYAQAHAMALAEVAGHGAALGGVAEAEQARVEQWQEGARAHAAGELSTRQAGLRSAAAGDAARARTAAATAAADSAHHVAADVHAARATGTDKAAAVSGDAAVRSAQAAAARELSNDTAAKVQDVAAGAAGAMRGQAEEIAGALERLGAQVAADLQPHFGGILEHLAGESSGAANAIGTLLLTSRGALAQHGEATASGLRRSEQHAIAALREGAARRREEIVGAGRTAAESLKRRAVEAMDEASGALIEAAAHLTGAETDEATAGELAATGEQRIAEAFGSLEAGSAGFAVSAASALAGFTDAAAGEFARSADAALSGAEEGAERAVRQAAELASGAKAQLTITGDQAISSGDDAVAGFCRVLDQHVEAAAPASEGLLADLRSSLDGQAAQVRSDTTAPTQSLGARIDTAQARAKERAQRSWISNQLHDLWESVTSPEFLVGLVVGLVVAAIIIASAGTATPFVIAAAAIAGGAAAGAAGTFTGNVRAGKRNWDLLDNVGRNALIGAAAGAAGAAVYLFGAGVVAGLGLAGTAAAVGGFVVLEVSAITANTMANLLNGDPWDKNLLTAMLLAPLVKAIMERIPGLRGNGSGQSEGEPAGGAAGRVRAQLGEGVDPVLNKAFGGSPVEFDALVQRVQGTTRPTPETIGRVRAYLERMGYADAPENRVMLERLERIARREMAPEKVDVDFLQHELLEGELVDRGVSTEYERIPGSTRVWAPAHDITRAALGVGDVYHPDAKAAGQ